MSVGAIEDEERDGGEEGDTVITVKWGNEEMLIYSIK